jgi:hypothetical protein
MNTHAQAADVLRRAVKVIQSFGWTRGSKGWFGRERLSEECCGFCVEGALLVAINGQAVDPNAPDDLITSARQALCCHPAYRALADDLGHLGRTSLWLWNDCRDEAQVIAQLERVAEKEEALAGDGV